MAKICVVDDDDDIREMISGMLTGGGHDTFNFSLATNALQFLKNNTVELVITDMQMPKMTGRDFIHHIRDDQDLAHLPIIVASGTFQEAELADLLDLDDVMCLPKPMAIEELVTAVDASLQSGDQ